MIPSTLQLPTPPNFAREAALSFQHAHRIMKALMEMYGTNWKTLVQGLVCWLVNESDIPAIQNFDKALDLVGSHFSINEHEFSLRYRPCYSMHPYQLFSLVLNRCLKGRELKHKSWLILDNITP